MSKEDEATLRATFEKWADDSCGGGTSKYLVRATDFPDEYKYCDVQQAWAAALYFYKLGQENGMAKP